MLMLIKAGMYISFGVLFFLCGLAFYRIVVKLKPRFKRRKEEKDIPAKLSSGKKQKYLNFKEVYPKATYRKYRLYKYLISCGLFLILSLLFNIVFGLMGIIIGFKIIDIISERIIKKRINKFELQLVDGLTLIANALKSGASFTQGVEVMVDETKPPLSEEFSQFLNETRLGSSVEDGLNNLTARVKSEELNIVVVAINIARQSGGNLSEILLHTADTIRERERIRGKVDALTSQGKMSGFVVGSLPIGLALILNFIDPVMMHPLFHSFIGQMVLLFVFIMEIIGFKWIFKIVDVDI